MRCWFTTFLCLHKEKFQKKVHQGANRFEFCLSKILHTFSPLDSPFGFAETLERFSVGEGKPLEYASAF